jgi:hypothetical protein
VRKPEGVRFINIDRRIIWIILKYFKETHSGGVQWIRLVQERNQLLTQ